MKFLISIIMIIAMAVPAYASETADVRYRFYDFSEGYFVVMATYKNEAGIFESYKGIVDMDGNIIVEPVWDECGLLHDRLALVWLDNEPVGYVDETGELAITLDSEHVSDASDFSEGLAAVKYDGLWGYIDTTGSFAIEPFTEGIAGGDFWLEYEAAAAFSDGYALISDENGYGFIDKTGNIVIPCIYEYADSFSGGTALVETEDEEGLIDKNGAWICEPGVYSFDFAADGYYVVRQNGLAGVMDASGNICVAVEWDWIYSLGNGIMCVVKDGMAGYHDVKGNSDVKLAFDMDDSMFGFGDVMDYCIGDIYCKMRAGDKFGVFDTSGNMVLEPIYDDIGEYSDGLFPVCLDGKYGYVDAQGKVVIDVIYDRAYRFGGGIAAVEKNRSLGFIDTEGNEVTEFLWYPVQREFGYGATYHEWNGRGVWRVEGYATQQLLDTEGNVISIGE